jgi:hypothetical protein
MEDAMKENFSAEVEKEEAQVQKRGSGRPKKKKEDDEGSKGENESKVGMSTKKERVLVGIDYDVESVIQLDEEGAELSFDDREGKFLELGPDDVRKLSPINRANYLLASHLYHYEEAQKGEPEAAELRISPRLSKASKRLDVRYPEGYREKFHTAWKRTDEVRDAEYDGFSYVKGEEVETFGKAKRPGDMHVIGAAGEDELVLMKKPREEYDAEMAEDKKRRQERVHGFDKRTMNEMRRISVAGHPGEPFGDRDREEWKSTRG